MDATQKLVLERLEASEHRYDVKCWSSAKLIDEGLIDYQLEGAAHHAKAEGLQQLVLRLWAFAEATVPGNAPIDAGALMESYEALSRVGLEERADGGVRLVIARGWPGFRHIDLPAADVLDAERTAEAWKVLLAVLQEAPPGTLTRGLTADAVDRLVWLTRVLGLASLHLAARAAQQAERPQVAVRDVERAMKLLISQLWVDGWARGNAYLPFAAAQAEAYARMKVANLQKVNGTPSAEERRVHVSAIAGRPVSAAGLRALEEVLLDLTLMVWRRADAATPAEHHLVAARDVYDAANATIASSLTDLGHVRFFERTSWEIELPGFRMDAFRDDGLHWRLILDVLDKHVRAGRKPARPLRPLDLYGAEELTETVSNYAAPLLVLAARGRDRVDEDAIRRTHAAVLIAVASRPPVDEAPAPPVAAPSASTPALRFVDVTAQVGVKPFEQPALLADAHMSGEDLMSFDAFRGVAVGDLNHDGWTDLFVAHEGASNALYLNRKGAFVQTTPKALAAYRGVTSAAFVDFDRDGCADLWLNRVYAGGVMLKGDCLGGLTDVTDSVGLGVTGIPSTGGVWFDADNDGWLDLYVLATGDFAAGFLPMRGDVQNAEPNRFWFNREGRFVEATDDVGLGDRRMSLAAVAFDADNDGDRDLYVVNDMQPNAFYRNEGGRFARQPPSFGLDDWGNGMGASVADVNGDGRLDIFLTNIHVMNFRARYVRRRPRRCSRRRRRTRTSRAVVKRTGSCWGRPAPTRTRQGRCCGARRWGGVGTAFPRR